MRSSSSPRRSIMALATTTSALMFALLCVSGPAGVSALHEDQVGSFDWHQQFLGRVTQSAFAGTKGNKRAFVSTEQGAIGALSFKTGEIVWRQVLEVGDVVDRLFIAGRMLISSSSQGKYLRAWSMKDGNLLWEVNTYTAAAPSADAAAEAEKDRGVDVLPLGVDVDRDGAEDILVLARGEVQLRSLSDGIVTWSTAAAAAFDKETVRLQRVVRGKDGNFIAVGVTEEDGYPAAIELSPSDGTVNRKVVSTGVGGLMMDASGNKEGSTSAGVTVRTIDGGAEIWMMGLAQDGEMLAATDVMRLLSGKKATTLLPLPEEAVGGGAKGSDASSSSMTAVRGSDTLSDIASLSAGAAVLRGGAGCALVSFQVASSKPSAKVLESWPLSPGGETCSAAVSAAFVESEATKSSPRVAVVAPADASNAADAFVHAVISLAPQARGFVAFNPHSPTRA